MTTSLPTRILEYRVTRTSPSEELVILGRILADFGDYAGTKLDHDHMLLAQNCALKLREIDDVSAESERFPSSKSVSIEPEINLRATDLTSMSIHELYTLYRRWPIRHKKRYGKGQEHLTYYFEHRIVKELRKRKPTTPGEQLKIDYCLTSYANEMDNLSSIFSLPIKANENKIYPDNRKHYTAEELTALISLYCNYKDITEREILIEYVDYAIDLLEQETNSRIKLPLVTGLAEIGQRGAICIPADINTELQKIINIELENQEFSQTELVLPMLTLHLISHNQSYEQKAEEIINCTYQSLFESERSIKEQIANLHISVVCGDYIDNFNPDKTVNLWSRLVEDAIVTSPDIDAADIYKLIEVATELKDFIPAYASQKNTLMLLLKQATSQMPTD